MTTIAYDNPTTIDVILESIQIAAGSPPTLAETAVVRPDITGTVGCSSYRVVSQKGPNIVIIKASPGSVYGVHIYNNAYYPVYAKLWDKATGVNNPAQDTGSLRRTVGSNAGQSRDANYFPGLNFVNGIVIGIMLSLDDASFEGVGKGDCIVEVEYA